MKFKYLLVLLFFICGYYLFYVGGEKSPVKKIKYAEVESKEILCPRFFKGFLTPATQIWYYAVFSSEVSFRVENGTVVKTGDIVLKFDTEDLEEKIKSHEEGVVDKLNALEELKLQQKAEMEIEKLNIQEAKLNFELATLNYQQAFSQPYEAVKREQALLIENSKLRKDLLLQKHNANVGLYEKGLLTLKSLQSSEVNLIKAESDLLRTSIQSSDKLKGVNKAQLARLQKQMELAKSGYNDAIEIEKRLKRIHELESFRILEEVKSVELKVKRYKAEYEDSLVKAPFDGKVYFPATYKGTDSRQSIEVGETPIRGVGLLYFTDSDDFHVHFHVSETEFLQYKIGDSLSFVLSSNPKLNIKGEILSFNTLAIDKSVSLGSLALDQRGEAGVQVIEVVGELKENHKDLRQGVTGTVKLVSVQKSKLSLPTSAIGTKNGKTVVKLKSGEVKEVVLGVNDGFSVEVVSGLQLGEVVEYE